MSKIFGFILKALCCVFLIQSLVCEDKTKKINTIVDFLVTNYQPNDAQFELEHNTIFPISINPEYTGKAKKLNDDLIYLKASLERMIKDHAAEALIEKTRKLIEKTQIEFDKVKTPFVKQYIESIITSLLVHVKEPYLDIIIAYSKSIKPILKIYVEAIANAIVNGQ